MNKAEGKGREGQGEYCPRREGGRARWTPLIGCLVRPFRKVSRCLFALCWLTRSCRTRSGWTPSVLRTSYSRGCCNLARRRRLIRCERGRTKSSNVGHHLERRTVVASDQMRLMMMMQPTDWWLPDRSTYLRSVAAGAALQRRRQRQQQPAHTCERLGPRDPLLAEPSERASKRGRWQ